MKFKEHHLAHQLLDGLEGLEIGGSAHNPFGLNTRNVDYTADMNSPFKLAELEMCGEAMQVDIVVQSGDELPLPDKSVDFVISSHTIEHFFDPIKAIKEWMRLSRKYVFIIAPLPNALPSDMGKPLTPLQELLDRHSGKIKAPEFDPLMDRHYSIWNCETFCTMCWKFIGDYGFRISHTEPVDAKVGNGFTVVLQFRGF